MRSFFTYIFITLLSFNMALAQEAETVESPEEGQQQVHRFFEFGINGLSYRGDLSDGFERYSGGLHIGLKLNKKKRFNGHVSLTIGNVEGQQRGYEFAIPEGSENLQPVNYFKTLLIAVGYDLQFNIIKKKNFTLYISQGFGLLRYSPQDIRNEGLRNQAQTRASDENYGVLTAIFPTNLGMMYYLPNNYGIGIQAGLLNPSTDYIDNLSDLSTSDRGDNVLQLKLNLHIPVTYDQNR